MVGNERAAVKPLPAADGSTHSVAKTVTVNPNGEAPSPGGRSERKAREQNRT